MIVGIDPGTTVGWAILDLEGKVVTIGSRKEVGVDQLVSKLFSHGKIMIVGTDKAKIPSFVQETATKFGARVIYPNQDMRVDEKRQIASNFKYNNSHEMDALSSALFAYKKIQPLLRKIDVNIRRNAHSLALNDVAELVIKDEISIHDAMLVLQPEEVIHEEKDIEEVKRDETVVKLFKALSRARKDNSMLIRKNNWFEKRLSTLRNRIGKLKDRLSGLVKPKTNAEISRIKESQIVSLTKRLENYKKAHELSKIQIETLENALLNPDLVPIIRFSRFGWDDVIKNKDLLNDTVIFVDDPNEISSKAVEWLDNQEVQLVLCTKLPSERVRSNLPFAFENVDDIQIYNRFILINSVLLDKARSKRLVLRKIVEEYQKRPIA